MVHVLVELASKILCVGLLFFQGVMINAYLSKLYCSAWWSWIVADILVIIIWVSCLVAVRRTFNKRKKDFVVGRDPEQSPDELKYTYIAWLSYVTLLCPRIVLLFADLVKLLDEKDFLGPNFLKMAVSCSPLIYFLLVHGAHNSNSHTERHISVQGVALSGALDLFDSIDLLDFLFLPEQGINFPRGYLHASLAFATVSFFLPVLSLYGLHYKALPGRVTSLSFKIIYISLNLALINIPNMVIRSVLWHQYHIDVSVLLMKNVMVIIAGVYEMLEYFGEQRPVICKVCRDWFEKSAYEKHKVSCGLEHISLSSTITTGGGVRKEGVGFGTISSLSDVKVKV